MARRHPHAMQRHPSSMHGEFGRDLVVAGRHFTPDEAGVGAGAAVAAAAYWFLGATMPVSLIGGLVAGWFAKSHFERG